MEAVLGRHAALLVGCNKGVTPEKLVTLEMNFSESEEPPPWVGSWPPDR
jgi:hypothetical protein